MAFQGDGVGKATFAAFSPTGDFRLTTPPIVYDSNGLQFLTRRTSNTNDFLGTDAGGEVRARVGGVSLPDLVVTGLANGDTIPSIVLSKISGTLTLAVGSQTTTAAANTNPVIFQEMLQSFQGVVDNGVFLFEDLTTSANNRRFNYAATSGTEIVDLEGNGNATLTGFTTGGFVTGTVTATKTVTFDIPSLIQNKPNMRYVILNNALTTVITTGTLTTSGSTVQIDLASTSVTNGQVLQMYATDKAAGNASSAVSAWDEASAVVTGG